MKRRQRRVCNGQAAATVSEEPSGEIIVTFEDPGDFDPARTRVIPAEELRTLRYQCFPILGKQQEGGAK